MIKNQILGICKAEGKQNVEISLKIVAVWTLIFTNAFFISYFFVRLLHLL